MMPFGLPELESPFDVAILVTQTNLKVILTFIFYSAHGTCTSVSEIQRIPL